VIEPMRLPRAIIATWGMFHYGLCFFSSLFLGLNFCG